MSPQAPFSISNILEKRSKLGHFWIYQIRYFKKKWDDITWSFLEMKSQLSIVHSTLGYSIPSSVLKDTVCTLANAVCHLGIPCIEKICIRHTVYIRNAADIIRVVWQYTIPNTALVCVYMYICVCDGSTSETSAGSHSASQPCTC